MGFFGKIRGAVAGAFMNWGGAYSEAVNPSPDRSNIMYYMPADSRQHLPAWTRSQINSKVQWLYENFGIVKEGVLGITRHTVGTGRALQLNSDDTEWNELAELDWQTYALSKSRCDLAGLRNFYDYQNLAVEQRLKQGEFLGAFCQNPRWPATYKDGTAMTDDAGDPIGDICVQAFDAGEIKTPPDKGAADRVFDGVRLDENKARVSYYAEAAGDTFQEIPESEFIHWFKPEGVNPVRGVSNFAQSVARLVDIHDLLKVTTKTGKLHGAIALLVKRAVKAGGQGAFGAIGGFGGQAAAPAGNGGGGPAPAGAGQGNGSTQGVTQAGGPPIEQVFGGGAIMYVDNKDDVQVVNSGQTSALVEPFVSGLLMRDTCAGWGVSAEFFWDIAKLSGANVRVVLSKAGLFFVVLGDGLDTDLGTPWATRYLLHRMACKKLRPCQDANWMQKMSWQGPPDVTADEGKIGALELQQLANGAITLQTLFDRRGRSWRPMIVQWFREWAFAKEVAEKLKVGWALPKWRAGQPGAGSGPTDNKPGEKKPDPEDDDEQQEKKGDDE